MQACSNTMPSSDRTSLSGTPAVPPVLAGAENHSLPVVKTRSRLRSSSLSSSGQLLTSSPPRTMPP